MNFEFTKEQTEFIHEVRQFIKKEATPELLRESHELEYIYGGPEARKFMKKFAADGWLTPSWPREYGGLGLPQMFTYIIRNELAYAGLPFLCTGAFLSGPTILRNGTEANKEYLIPISKGEIEFALGYSEPAAGSDLLSLQMHAEDKGDYFLVNGQKTFNTHAHVADYHWLAVRTDRLVSKHKGLSFLIVDLKSKGITITPMTTMAGTRTNEVYYDNVEVPKINLVGEKNEGYKYLMSALDHERAFPYGHYKNFFESLVEYAKNHKLNNEPITKNPLIRQKLAQIEIRFEIVKLLYFELAYLLDNGKIPSYQSSMEKTFFSELCQDLADLAMEIAGLSGQIKEEEKRTVLDGMVDYFYQFSVVETIWGGSSEIQRSIIAQRGLGLPR